MNRRWHADKEVLIRFIDCDGDKKESVLDGRRFPDLSWLRNHSEFKTEAYIAKNPNDKMWVMKNEDWFAIKNVMHQIELVFA